MNADAPAGDDRADGGDAAEAYCYLTTVGRRSGRPHEIEIWFARHGERLYLISGGGQRSDWVRNLQHEPGVAVRVGERTWTGVARTLEAADHPARRLLATKYQGWRNGQPLSAWAAEGLLIEVVPDPDPR